MKFGRPRLLALVLLVAAPTVIASAASAPLAMTSVGSPLAQPQSALPTTLPSAGSPTTGGILPPLAPPSAVPAAPAAPTATLLSVAGTWALVQANTATQLTHLTPAIDTALATPGVRGLSLRVPWSSIASSLSLVDAARQIASAHGAGFVVRFVAGVDTPAQVFAAGANSTVISGGLRIPLPWGAGSTPTNFVPNTAFEQSYTSMVSQLAAYSRAHGMHELHLPWYSERWAELYNGPDVQRAPGYSYQNWLTGHERLLQIAMRYAGPDLVVEFPLTGIGAGSGDMDLSRFIMTTWGSWNSEIIMQENNLTATPPPHQGPSPWQFYQGKQMMGMGDYNWAAVYQILIKNSDVTIEVYASSFDPSLPHASLLRQEINMFATHAQALAAGLLTGQITISVSHGVSRSLARMA